jgi:hypothetical protein
MTVKNTNVRLVTTITKATDGDIKRLAEGLGLTYRVVVSMALSIGLRSLEVNVNPSKYLTPETVAAFNAFQKVAETTPAQDAQMMSDLELGAKQDKKLVAKKPRAKSSSSKK